jgi:two-component system chemotaxis response regulator CheB
VVFGASEGGYSALLKIIPQLKPDTPAVFIAVLYAAPPYVDAFVSYLNRYSAIDVKRATDGTVLQGGTCYLAAGSEYITVVRENQALGLRVHPSPFPARRGAINMLMLSLSEIMAENAVGVILSGQEQDGAEGVIEVSRMGGDVIVQAPETCLFKEMPQTALKLCESCQVIPDIYIADAIDTLLHETLTREEESYVEKS